MTTDSVTTESPTQDYADVDEQFSRLAVADSERERTRCRAQIITRCLTLADHIAYRYAGRGEPSEDLVQVARVGLVKAVDRYQPAKGKFLAFAVPTIIGEVRRHFRDNTWGMRVPRRVKENTLRVRAAIGPMTQRLGRAPTAGELATELRIDRDEITQSVVAASAYRPLSLDAPASGRDEFDQTLGETQGAEDPHYDTIEDMLALADGVSELSDRERTILRMRFGDCLTQSQIARMVGISQVHVSRILSATLDRLRSRFWGDAQSVSARTGRATAQGVPAKHV